MNGVFMRYRIHRLFAINSRGEDTLVISGCYALDLLLQDSLLWQWEPGHETHIRQWNDGRLIHEPETPCMALHFTPSQPVTPASFHHTATS